MRENPFRYGPAALGPHFTDRTSELETLVRDLFSRQNVVIISPRRFGKTSLALTARNRLITGKILVAYADLFGPRQNTASSPLCWTSSRRRTPTTPPCGSR